MAKQKTQSLASLLSIVKQLRKKLDRDPLPAEIIQATGLSEWLLRKKFGSASALIMLTRGKLPPPKPLPLDEKAKLNLQIRKLQDENLSLSELLRETEKKALTSETMQDLIGSMNEQKFERSPEWLRGLKASRRNTGTPFLLLSDIHFDEVVSPDQIGHCNEYNRVVAEKRIKNTFHRTIMLMKKHLASPKYDGIVCALGGDMLSGNIHEELAETNEVSINQSLFKLTDLLINGIGELADEFGKVFVPCVVGNHGRLHRMPRMKNRVFDNFEWIIYQYIARYFKNDSRITMQIPDGADALFKIYDKSFCLTHGDQFRGGGGIAGIFTPIMLGAARKQKRQAAIKDPFDIIVMGHWHQLIMMEHLIVNGSIKGYDEYAYINNFPFEPPQQALFVVHKDRGMTYRIPIFCGN